MASFPMNPGDRSPRRGPPIEGEADAVAIVPFVPWRCPSCGDTKPRTYSQRGRIRYHLCPCGLRFRSLEMSPECLADHPQLREEI